MTRRWLPALGLVALLAVPTAAQTPQLVLDIDVTSNPLRGTEPAQMTPAFGALFYAGADDENGFELRRREASGATALVLDARPGPTLFADEGPRFLTLSGPKLMFSEGQAIWRSDGTTAGTSRVRTWIDVDPVLLTDAGGLVYFRTQGVGPEQGLWRSDGTEAGTTFLTGQYPEKLTGAGGRLFFYARTSAAGSELWTSDGTPAGTHMVADVCPGPCDGADDDELLAVGSTVYFPGYDGVHGSELWKSDGTPAGTVMVVDSVPGNGSVGPNVLGSFGSRVLFQGAQASGNGRAVWTSDGTPAGTFALRPDLRVFSTFHDAGPVAYFGAQDENNDIRLWKTDGTAAGTLAVTPVCANCLWFSPDTAFATLGDVTLFSNYLIGVGGTPLWRTDGTAAGTFALGPHDVLGPLVPFGGAVYFDAWETAHGGELWRSDGTVAGTVRVTDRVDVSSYPRQMGSVGDRLFFEAERPDLGLELWSTRGDAASTSFVDVQPGPEGTFFYSPAALDDALLVGAVSPGGAEYSLLRSDGTAAGTTKLQTNLSVASAARAGDLVFFAGGYASSGAAEEPWRSDGTAAGTLQIADLGPGSSAPRAFEPFLDRAAFLANGQPRLWTSDGTEAGTVLLSSLQCLQKKAVEQTLFALCIGPGTGWQLWATDGTAEGMRLVHEFFDFVDALTAVEGTLYFTVAGELWRSDGTSGGTVRLADVVGVPVGEAASGLIVANGILFYQARTAATGSELWRTDGTAAGTFLVRDIWPGPDSGYLPGLGGVASAGGRIFFPAYQPATGLEPWQSDGTAGGTTPLGDIAPGPASSVPQYFAAAGGRLYFAASDNLRGAELWTVPLAVPAAAIGDAVVREGDGAGTVATFTVRMEPAPAATTTVSYRTVAGTAQAGTDFTPQAGTLTFAPGVPTATIAVPIVGDLQDEPEESFDVRLTAPGGVFADARGSAVILDDDGPRAAAAGSTVVEGDAGTSAATFAVTLTTHDGTPTPAAKSVGYATAPVTATSGTDYAASSGTLTFPAGTPSGTTLTVTVAVNGDTLDEPDETFALLFTPTSDIAVPPPAIGLVADDDGIDAASPVELQPGASVRATLEPPPGRSSDRDYYVLAQQPYASYELVVDETSGDAVPLEVHRVAADGSTVLQAGTAVGTGAGVSLRWQNSTNALVTSEHVAVSSAACGTACGPDDRYRVRMYETTLSAPRFNNTNGQGTVVLLQNASDATISGRVALWVPPSTLVRYEAFTIAPRGVLALNTLPLWPGSGSITVTHDGAYGALVGKAVALEPATGFSFDTPLTPRTR
jgi:ELWxxDGT repeat protein